MTSPGRPPIPTLRSAITADIKRCANTRADLQNRVVDDLFRIDAITRRIDELMDALKEAPA